jgi:peptidoglycan/LPS O-acetylase OafA/YrhL
MSTSSSPRSSLARTFRESHNIKALGGRHRFARLHRFLIQHNDHNIQRRTIGFLLDRNNGFAPGFGFLRLIAATLVYLAHVVWLSTGHYDPLYAISHKQTFLGSIGVGVFFVISGFLIAQSFARCSSVIEFAMKRILRIFPGLFVVVALSALLVGPALTTLPLRQYFSNELFSEYFLNAIGGITLLLPGVFNENPIPIVNGSLWTLRYEALCYAILALVGISRLLSRKSAILVAAGLLVLLGGLAHGQPREILILPLGLPLGPLGTLSVGPLLRLLPYFMVGTSSYLWRYYLPLDWRLAIVAAIGVVLGLLTNFHDLLFPICGGYLAIYVGMLEALDFRWLRTRDYSYGIYIYSFPVQQVVIALFPMAKHWWINALLSGPLTLALAALSWSFVERPALSLKKMFPSASK